MDSRLRANDGVLPRHLPLAALFLTILAAGPSQADFSIAPQDVDPSGSEPVLLAADTLNYDRDRSTVTATGSVEVTQGATILLADTLIYDQLNNQIVAIGNVSMLEPSGNVYFAERAELKDDMKAGLVRQFKARLSDGSVFVAAGADKLSEQVTELTRASYTPCKCEENGRPVQPFWQLDAGRATIDQNAQRVRYRDASVGFGGVPVLYTPYFSHPTPGAANQSGLLAPEIGRTSNLGATYRQPFYYSIAPDRDATFIPIYTQKAGNIFGGEYRQAFDSGPLNLQGTITNAPKRDDLGNNAQGRELRGNIDARGAFRIDEASDWGFNIRRASDDTYLRRYNFSNDNLLTSRAYAEKFDLVKDSTRSYAAVEGLAFQGLTGQDDSDRIPYVLPLSTFSYQSDPLFWHSRASFDANAMALYREEGAQSRRLSGVSGWKLPYLTGDGQLIEFNTQLRTDVYHVNNVRLSDGRDFAGVTGRVMPEASLLWRYPFIKRFSRASSFTIEPVVQLAVSPGGGNPEKIPNEDSLLPEFTDANLFETDRFAGLDRVQHGPRASYGIRAQAQIEGDKYVDFLVGQHYQVIADRLFPFSQDLNDHFSDYVGHVGVNYRPFTVAYRFRLDKENLAPNRSEVDASINYYPFTVSSSYLSLRRNPVLATKEIITGNAAMNLTREWSVNLGGTHDLLLDQSNVLTTGMGYKNECIAIAAMVGKDYTNILDVKPSLNFWLTVSLKNLD